MEWLPIDGYEDEIDMSDKPRTLTDKELEFIVSHIPLPPSADLESAELAHSQIAEWAIETLKDVKIAPSAIPELIERIIRDHNKSLVAPGTPVGITAAEAVGASTTQMTLNSVAPWERILIQDNKGMASLVLIGEWIDSLIESDPTKVVHIPENRTQYFELSSPVQIATPHADGSVTWEKITAVTKHLPVGDMVNIRSRSGREVTATQSKSILLWDGTELVQKEGKYAKVGDLVPVISDMPEPKITYDHINLRKYLSDKEWLYGSELHKLYDSYNQYQIPGKRNFWSSDPRLEHLPYTRGDNAVFAFKKGIEQGYIKPNYVYPKMWGGSTQTMIPENFPLDRQFGQIVGLYLSEGWATDTFFGISNNAPEIQDLIYQWCDRYGITYHTVITESSRGKSSDIKVHSVLFARWFKQWMQTGSEKKIMPPEILLGNRDFIIGVLDGYFAGDGTVNKRDHYLVITSASKDLITGFGFLCSRLGIFGKQSGHQPKSNNIGSKNIRYVNSYTIRNKNAALWAKIVGSCHQEKKQLMENIESKLKNRVEWGRYYKKQNQIMLDPIVSVKMVPATEYVYDLTVPVTTNFSLWNGLGVADTFHSSGAQKSASFGIEAMRDLIFARKTLKHENSTIYFTDKSATFEEILNRRKDIVGSMMSDFIKDYDIDSPNKLPRYWWHDISPALYNNAKEIQSARKVLRLFLNTVEMYKHRVSIEQLASVLEKEVPPSIVAVYGPISDGIIDLYPVNYTKSLDDCKLSAISGKIAELTFLETIVYPELSNIRVKGIAGIKQLYPQVSPVWRIVMLEQRLTRKFKQEHNLTHPSGSWILYVNPFTMKMTGLTLGNLAALCRNAGMTNLNQVEDRALVVTLPSDRWQTKSGEVATKIDGRFYRKIAESNLKRFDDQVWKKIIVTKEKDGTSKEQIDVDNYIPMSEDRDLYREIEGDTYKRLDPETFMEEDGGILELITWKPDSIKPSQYVNRKIKLNKDRDREEFNRRNKEISRQSKLIQNEVERRAFLRKPIIIPRSDLLKSSEFVFAMTEGSNLKELLALPGIDKRRTTCNNMYTITETLGIEATRTFLIRSLTQIITETSSYVHPANIMFIAEFITSRGEPYGATYSGISRQPYGHLSLATLERAGKVFTQNALHGRKEDVRNVSASIVVGTRMAIGSGFFDIAQDVVIDGTPKTLYNDDVGIEFIKDDQIKSEIEQLNLMEREALQSKISDEEFLTGTKSESVQLASEYDYTAEDDENAITNYDSELHRELEISRLAREVLNRSRTIETPTPNVGQSIQLPSQSVPTRGAISRVVKPPEVVIIPEQLVNAIDNVQIGIPFESGESSVPAEVPIQGTLQSIVSTGIIVLDQFMTIIPTTSETQVDSLMEEYQNALARGEITRIVDLPSHQVPSISLPISSIDLRAEQIRDLSFP